MLMLFKHAAASTALAVLAVVSTPAAAIDWPQFRFDDAHTGHNPLEQKLDAGNVPQLQLGWAAQLGKLVFSSSPAVVDGVAYIGSSDGRLWAYPAKGCGSSLCTEPLWRSTHLSQIIDSPAVKDGIVYVGSQTNDDNNNGRLNAFAAAGCGHAECAPLWQGRAGKESLLQSSPTVADGVVYVGAYDGRLYAFAAAGCGASMCDPLWTGKTRGTTESTPVVQGGVVYIGSDDGRLYAFAAAGCGAATCEPLWTGRLPGPAFDSSPAVVDGVVYIGAAHGVAAFAAAGCGAAECAPLWKAVDKLQFFGGSPAVAEGRVYIGLEGMVAVYDAVGCGKPKCKPLWLLFGAGAQAIVASSPTVANGVVYAGRNTGQVLAWKSGSCGQSMCDAIWSTMVNEQIVNSSPTVVNGRLYIGSADNAFSEDTAGRLYVFELP